MIASPTFSDLHALDQHFLLINNDLPWRSACENVGRGQPCPAKRVKAEEEVKAEELEAVKVEDVPNAAGCGSMPPLEKP
jgi:hypothetical protein